MQKTISRRAFLKGSVAAVGTLAAGSVAKAVDIKDGTSHLATLMDIRKCIGCEACVEACREANADQFPNPQKP